MHLRPHAMSRAAALLVSPRTAVLLVAAAASLHAAPAAAQQGDHEWAAARYEATLFDDGSDAWHYASLEVGARRARLTPIARVNVASRNGGEGIQLEADLYPAWPGLGYAYLSGAWSASAPFPELRAAGEMFVSLPSAWETSAGAIYMDFDDDDVTIAVGSISKYAGNYWLSVRPSWAFEPEEFAIALVARRYLRTAGEFVTVRGLFGTTPETIETEEDAARTASFGVLADAQLEVSDSWLVLPLAGLATEELAGGEHRLRASLGVGAMLRF